MLAGISQNASSNCFYTLLDSPEAIDASLHESVRGSAIANYLRLAASNCRCGVKINDLTLPNIASALQQLRRFTRDSFNAQSSVRRQLTNGAIDLQSLQVAWVADSVLDLLMYAVNSSVNASALNATASEGALTKAFSLAEVSVRTGCLLENAENYDSLANIQVPGLCVFGGCVISSNANFNPDATFNDGSCSTQEVGCTDSRAPNYNPHATKFDGSCIQCGCDDSSSLDYDPMATPNNIALCGNISSCRPAVFGCMDPTSINYNSNATFSNSSECVFHVFGCNDPTATNYVPGASQADPSNPCIQSVLGCTDSSAVNFVSNANVDDIDAPCIPVIKVNSRMASCISSQLS